MDWKDIATSVGQAAPLLGRLLIGPAGGAVGSLVASALGVTSPEQAEQALAIDPEAAVKLRQLELDHQGRLQELAVQAEAARLANQTEQQRIAAADRDSARRAAVDGGTHKRVFGLTVTIFLVVVSVEAAALLMGIPPGLDGQMVGRILGTLDAALLAALYYTYGSSAGSARKDELAAAKG